MRNAHKEVKPKGTFFGIGIGPGDPKLLTLKAIEILKKVDIIFAPKSRIKTDSLAAEIIKPYIPKNSIIREVIFPMSRDKKRLANFWEKAALKIYREISLGKDVAFITMGDPFVYSTYIYLSREIRRLNKNLKIVTVPGISSINAASSLLEIPLACSDEKFAVIPMPGNLKELKGIFSLFDTVVLLKIGNALSKLVKFLKKEGLEKQAFFVSRAGLSKQLVGGDISSLNKKTSGYLSIVIVKLRKRGG
ncbi:MAG: precorrin-2 C(20)-methyltransferase [Candidatus Hydrogenedentota bacterium]